MASNYSRLFSIRFKHSYYDDRNSYDFSVVPLPQTQKLARQYKLIFRVLPNGLEVLSLMKAENTPFIDLGSANKLSFAIILKNTNVLNITTLPAKRNSRQVYYLNNILQTGNSIPVKDWKLVEPKSDNFTYALQSEANEIVLKTTDSFGNSQTAAMLKQGNRFLSDFHLGGRQEGRYLFESTRDGQEKQEEAFYSSEMLWKTRPFGLIDVFTKELTYNRSKNYSIKLSARKSSWIYRVNLTKDYTGSTISIKDERLPPEVLFKIAGNPVLSKGKTLTFRAYNSDAPDTVAKIKFSENAIRDFKLVIEKNGAKTEIRALPNPAIDQVKSEMHINI